jgi:16S rRNA processing protein RimM
MIVKFAGIDSPEQAKQLSSAEVLVDRDKAAPLYNNEFYYEDLRGLSIVSCDGTMIGIIGDIIEGGGGTLIEVRCTNGKSCFVPFRDEFIGEINLEKGTAVLLHEWIIG